MKKQIQALVEIGIIYLVASIILNSILGGYPILIWPVLGVVFILFAIMIFDVLWEPTVSEAAGKESQPARREDELMRLEHLCKVAIDQGDATAGESLSDRVRSLAFSAAAYHLNESETKLRTMAEQEPDSLQTKIGDQQIFSALITNGSIIRKRDPQTLESYLKRIEDWTN